MSSSDQASASEQEDLGVSAREFLAYATEERERRRNSGESFDQEAYDRAVDRVMRKLRALGEEGWS
jgi:hypothetical protein